MLNHHALETAGPWSAGVFRLEGLKHMGKMGTRKKIIFPPSLELNVALHSQPTTGVNCCDEEETGLDSS